MKYLAIAYPCGILKVISMSERQPWVDGDGITDVLLENNEMYSLSDYQVKEFVHDSYQEAARNMLEELSERKQKNIKDNEEIDRLILEVKDHPEYIKGLYE